MFKLILVISLLLLLTNTHAQKGSSVLRANSRLASIRDGMHFMQNHWYIQPEKKPDYYYTDIPGREGTVTFITDLDSISFDLKYGEYCDFIILLNNKDSCHTRISATYKKLMSFNGRQFTGASDTIPFTIGDNSKIYFKASLNNSAPLNVQFDLGAGGNGIKKASVSKVRMTFDDSLILHNSDGSNLVPSSSNNVLEIAGIKWDGLLFSVADNYTNREDLLVGNQIFQNKVLEIDYDNKRLVVHDFLPFIAPTFTRHDMILSSGVIPFIQGSITIGSSIQSGWFMFDTGAYTSILNTNEAVAADKSLIELRKMLGITTATNDKRSPRISIGNYSFAQINYTVQKANKDVAQLGVLGNDILKRFNVFIDNKAGYIFKTQHTSERAI